MQSPTKVGKHRSGFLPATLPLPTLLSHVLVAFTIEFDNEFEHQMPHRTTNLKTDADGPWLVSLVMFSNFMQFVGEEGVAIGELQRLTRTAKLPLDGMERWGYVEVGPDPADRRPKAPHRDWVVRPTAEGRKAKDLWRPLFGRIEKRWQARFGKDEIEELRESLSAMVNQFDVELPDYLPVLGYGMVAEVPHRERRVPAEHESGTPGTHLPTLLSNGLLAFTVEFERKSDLSLAISANILRVLTGKGVPVRDLPRLSGVSKEAIKTSIGFLEKRGYVAVKPDPSAKGSKLVCLTPKGQASQETYRQRLGDIEESWQGRFGKDNIRNLRESLERLIGGPTAQQSPLFRGLEPYPDGWRASVPRPDTLPHYPMVLHRGGYPDGS